MYRRAETTPPLSSQRFTVTISAGQRAGHYVGTSEIRYAGLNPNQPLTITLDVTVESIPAVDVEVSSKNLVMPLRPLWSNLRWGKPASDNASPELGEIVVSLVQNSEGIALVEGAEVLAMRGTKGYTLPSNTLRVPTTFPLTLTNQDTTSLRIVAVGDNLRADEYNGALFIKVHNQPNALTIPLKVQVKDGPILAIVCLLLGPTIGFIVRWSNSGGRERNRLAKRIDELDETLGKGEYLARDKQQELDVLLNTAKQAIVDGRAVEEITQKLEALTTALNSAQAETRRFITGRIEPLRTHITGLNLGQAYREKLLRDLEKIQTSVVNGTVASLQDAGHAVTTVQTNVTHVETALQKYEGLPESVRDTYREALNTATSLEGIQQIVASAAQTTSGSGATPHFGSYGAGGTPAEAEVALTQIDRDWDRERVKLRLGALAATVLVYAFAWVVGYITFYVAAPTFGSDPAAYISLLLWGATSSFIGARTVDLQQLYTSVKEPRK